MVNKVILVGNLGADPELRYTPGGQPVCSMRLATKESWTGRDGQRAERTEWHSIVVWGKQGENTAHYLRKGRQVYVEGRLQTRSWEGKDGVKRYKTEIVATNVVFLQGGSRSESPRAEEPPTHEDFDAPPVESTPGDDDIPF
ncbi:MAG: single-stranded DNA-binding protein [Deltaproteobacteria bacterium]|nr:single-stranded DNA-binding protein [Deltaproteobacteria bacterium]